MKGKIQLLIEENFYLVKNDKISEFVEIIYKFYITQNILSENENKFYYDKECNGFVIHNILDIKECIKNDIDASIHTEQYEDGEPIITTYHKRDLYNNIEMTLEQYDYCL